MLALPDSIWLLPLFAAVAAAGLAIWILVLPWSEVFHRRLTLVLALTALVELSHAALLFVPSDAVFFREAGLSLEFLRMGAFFLTGAALIVGTSELGSSLKRRSRVAVVAGLVGALFAWWGSFSGIDEMAEGAGLVRLGPNGRWLQVALLLGLVLAIAQLESVLRASRDPFRFRIKFLILGLCALAGFEVYVASQTMLLGSWRLHHAALSGLVTFVSVGLVAFGLGRMRLARTLERVSVSPQAVYGSFTLLGVGLYLLGVGLLGEVLRLSGRTLSVGFTELGVFFATLALVAAASSRAVRARFRELVSRNLLRSRYDYRTKWLEVTDAFRGAETVEQVLDRLLHVLGRTFAAPRLSIFMRYEADDRFHQVRSLNIEAPPAPIDELHPVVVALSGADEPTDLRASDAGKADAFLAATRAVFGVPLRGAGELLGFVTLGPRPGGESYDVDDRDMLRAIAHHASVLLGHARMADDRQASAELDALNRFAAFCLHDFKNLAARLSLVTQNAAKYGEDPEFRAESMKTIARTAEQMGDLMAQLSRRSPDQGRVAALEVAELVAATLRSLGPDAGVALELEGEPGQVLAVPEQLQQVLLNLVLNAKRAVERDGAKTPVRVSVRRSLDRVRLEVVDSANGIPPERLRTLFQPFQSGEAGGFGIGLYESKRIVESYRGTIRLESEVGRGTRVVVELPAIASAAAVVQTAQAEKEKTP
ncbi:MAG TPA: XrtA/PEP-CTERM system histidine kinase PrsK [Vicinamibacteria bacterium]